MGGGEQGENSARGALTVTACVSNGSSRHAMPSLPELVYAALLYTDDNKNENFAQAETADGGKLKFSFQRPKETSDLILEIFAFVKTEGESTPQFSRGAAPFSKAKEGLAIVGDAINVSETIVLEVNDSPGLTGTVSLEIKVPDGCSLEIDDTTHFAITGTSPNFTLTQAGDGIPAGAYQVTFTVKKEVNESDEIIHIFSEYINVINGLCTDTWSGLAKGAAKEITNSISKAVYVRGTGGWYDGGELTLNGATVSQNTATESGGDVYAYNRGYAVPIGKLNFYSTTFAGDLYLDGKTVPRHITAHPDLVCVDGKTVCATITLPEGKYVAGTKILQAADGETITQDVCGKFAVSQDGWEIVPNDDGVAGVLGIVSQ